jgi:spore maturation protein CgeB
MKLVVFGLTVSSSWGNGHATLWRGLIRALGRMGWDVVFFERDAPYYAAHRDLTDLSPGRLVLYGDWMAARAQAAAELLGADAALVTSYCPDGPAASALIAESRAVSVFYDMDTPVTLARLQGGERVDYLPADGLRGFDLVLSYTGGRALEILERSLGARRTAVLYGHVDPDRHHPVAPEARFAADVSYLGTYAADRQPALEALFIGLGRTRPELRLRLGGAGYPQDFPWSDNIWFSQHVAPADHPAFFSSSRLTVNVTRRDMAAMGWCPSGRLFEAAACGTPVLTDPWEGLEAFFAPGEEILVASSTAAALEAIEGADLEALGRRARERALDEHTSAHRARELTALLEAAARPPAEGRPLQPADVEP